MLAFLQLLGAFVANLFQSRHRLEVENLFLRHQLNIALRGAPRRLRLRGSDRALMVWMTWLWPSLLGLSRVVQPDTILRWHRAGFRAYWRWKSRARPGRPRVSRELRELIQRMGKENPLWGAPRIHGELLKLGFEIAESTVSKYMIRRRGPPSQTWRTFLHNHAHAIAAIDLCLVPTLTFECLFAFLVLGHGRRQLLWFAVTRHPTAEWLAQQIVEAFPWGTAPTYLVRDNDGAYGQAFTSRIRAMGIRDRPISPRSPWAGWTLITAGKADALGRIGDPRQSVRLSVLSAQTLMPDASIDSPSSNVPRRSKRQSLACGSLADACLPDFSGPTTFFQSAEPDLAASSRTRSALREFVTVTVTVTAEFALGLAFGAASAVRPNRVAPTSAAASVRVFIRFTP
jgi:hypothetical protein